MATNKTGVAIIIRAFLPTGTGIDESFMALAMVKDARDTNDYSKVLAASTIDDVTFKQVNRRVADAAPAQTTEALPAIEETPATDVTPATDETAPASDEETPKRRGKAA